jgi:hypothetical protein
MSFVKFLMLLSLVLWIGAIVFFSVAVAPTVLAHIADRATAGAIISDSIVKLHWIGLVCGIVFLLCSFSLPQRKLPDIAVVLMLASTAISQFKILPAIAKLRGATDPASLQRFDTLHSWSVSLEMATLILGLVTIYLLARRLS